MKNKKILKKLMKWVKKYQTVLILSAAAGVLAFSLQLVGCNESLFYHQANLSPDNCDEVNTGALSNGECKVDVVDFDDDLFPDECEDADCKVVERCDSDDSDCQDVIEICDRDGDCRRRSVKSRRRDRDDDQSRRNRRGRAASTPVISFDVQLGRVDIVFVVDNSQSMAVEHRNIANQFDNFMNDIEDLDYRIAMTTVDISSSPNNEIRDYQDGMFIEFDDGSYYLYNDEDSKTQKRRRHKENVGLFKDAIERPETRKCNDDPSKCPDDERAICAISMALDDRNQNDFFRKDSHLMFIVISDEDERSSKEFIEEERDARNDEYEFEDCDWPDTVYRKISQRLGPTKNFSVHAIIIPPGDEECLEEQRQDGGHGYYGEMYSQFTGTNPRLRRKFPNLRRGKVSSICDRNYDDQLGTLSRYLESVDPITLPCDPSSVRVRLKGESEKLDHRVEGRTLVITENVPINANLRIQTYCKPGTEDDDYDD